MTPSPRRTEKPEPAPIPDAFRKPRKVKWWGHEYTITPAVADSFQGDGKRWLAFQPLNTRPEYYLIRVDSKAGNDDLDDFRQIIDEVIELLCEEFGDIEGEREIIEEELRDQGIDPDDICVDLDGNEDRLGFPVLSLDSGYGWWDVDPEDYE